MFEYVGGTLYIVCPETLVIFSGICKVSTPMKIPTIICLDDSLQNNRSTEVKIYWMVHCLFGKIFIVTFYRNIISNRSETPVTRLTGHPVNFFCLDSIDQIGFSNKRP